MPSLLQPPRQLKYIEQSNKYKCLQYTIFLNRQHKEMDILYLQFFLVNAL